MIVAVNDPIRTPDGTPTLERLACSARLSLIALLSSSGSMFSNNHSQLVEFAA
jgi:hypothetical protein